MGYCMQLGSVDQQEVATTGSVWPFLSAQRSRRVHERTMMLRQIQTRTSLRRCHQRRQRLLNFSLLAQLLSGLMSIPGRPRFVLGRRCDSVIGSSRRSLQPNVHQDAGGSWSWPSPSSVDDHARAKYYGGNATSAVVEWYSRYSHPFCSATRAASIRFWAPSFWIAVDR
jgi:hypothetical protein